MKYIKNSIFIRWLLSYFLILILPIAFIGSVYLYSFNIILDEMEEMSLSVLSQVRTITDEKLIAANNIILQITLNKHFVKSSYIKEEIKDSDRYNLLELIEDVHSYASTNNYINDWLIFLQDSNKMIVNSNISDSEFYFDTYIKALGFNTLDSFNDFINSSGDKTILLPYNDTSNEMHTPMIAYIQTSSTYSPIILYINVDILKSITQDIEWLIDGNVYILDNNNNLIASIYDDTTILSFQELNSNELFHKELNGEKTIVSTFTSKIADWKYVVNIPYYIFLDKIDILRLLMLIIIAICLR